MSSLRDIYKEFCANDCGKKHNRDQWVHITEFSDKYNHATGTSIYVCSKECKKEFENSKMCSYCYYVTDNLIDAEEEPFHWNPKLKLCTVVRQGKTCYEKKYMEDCYICNNSFKRSDGREIFRSKIYDGYREKFICPECIEFIDENQKTINENPEMYCRECQNWFSTNPTPAPFLNGLIRKRAIRDDNSFCNECIEKLLEEF